MVQMSDVRPEHPVRATTTATRARFTVADETAAVRDPAHGELSENALRVLKNRYLKKDDQGKVVETPLQMFHRVGDAVAKAERQPEAWSPRFFEMMWNRSFMPNSPTLMNAGRPLGMLSSSSRVSIPSHAWFSYSRIHGNATFATGTIPAGGAGEFVRLRRCSW